MIYVVSLLLSLGVLFYVLYPLFQKKYRFVNAAIPLQNPNLSSLKQTKNELLMAIKEIEFEFQMGKISLKDYEHLKTDYQNKALQILQKIDDLEKDNVQSDPIEEQVYRYRQLLKKDPERIKNKLYCPDCGQKVQSDYRFCTRCGRKLKEN